MKREEFFEALSDIDEGMVENAKPYEEPVSPITVTPKRSFVKPVCIAAACVALAAAVTAIAVKVTPPDSVFIPNIPSTQEREYKTTINVVNKSSYPADTIYPYSGNYSNLEIKYIGDEMPNYPEESHYKLYEELAEDSSLVIMGTFTDDSYQITDYYSAPDFAKEIAMSHYPKYMSFNTFKVEKVLKSDGQVWEGDEIAIAQPYVIADGALYSFSQSTPMIKGDSWVYFLRQYSSDYPEEIYGTGAYYPVNDYEGRYPVPDRENPPFQYRENTKGVVAPAVFNEGVYSEIKEKLENAPQHVRPPYELEYEKVIGLAEALGYDNNDYPVRLDVEFTMEEFEGITFGWQNGELYSRTNNSEEKKNVVGGPGCYVNLGSTYLCDLTGDGKREICTCISFGSGIVHDFLWVADQANNKLYVLSERGETDHTLKKQDGELYLVSQKFSMSYYPSYDENNDEVKKELLTIDMLTEIDPNQEQQETTLPEEIDSASEKVFKVMDLEDGYSDYLTDMALTFDMEEFPGVMFERDPGGASADALYAKTGEGETATHKLFETNEGGLSSIISIYLCDLNGDGNREICINAADYNYVRYICVYDYANSQKFTLSDNVKETPEFEYILIGTDDTLFYNKNALIYEGDFLIHGDCVLSEPLTLDVMVNTTSLPNLLY